MSLNPLPIDALLEPLVSALSASRSAVVQAPAGAGKTTRVPPALLDAGLAGGRRVVVLEPRRVAARAAARRIAEERAARLGDAVGYHVRYDRVASARTRLLVVTEGILLRMLQRDPFLEDVGAVVFDEFHERRLDTDLSLAMARRVQLEARPDLTLVVMSATLETAPVAAFLGDCPVLTATARAHPVEIEYLEPPALTLARPSGVAAAAAAGVRRLLPRVDGDVLVFLPGVGEIQRTAAQLGDWAGAAGVALCPLYGELPGEAQDAALRAGPGRRVVLATNVAETSVTVEGVAGVVDTGLARLPRYDPATGLDRLELVPISRASADQRAGRAGRLGPGRCLRLWTPAQQRALSAHERPEVGRLDLAAPVLQLIAWGEPDPARFAWFDPPEPAALEAAAALLRRLGALDGRGLTPIGRTLSRLPVHPRLGRLLLESHRLGHLEAGCALAALLSERDPVERDWAAAGRRTDSDVLDRLELLERPDLGPAADGAGPGAAGLRPGAARAVRRAAEHLRRLAGQVLAGDPDALGGPPLPPPDGRDEAAPNPAERREALLRAILVAYPDRVARRRAPGDSRAVLVGGRGARLLEASGVRDAPLFTCVEVDAGSRGPRAEALVRQASAVDPAWLPVSRQTVLGFDPERLRVSCEERTRYEDLVIEARPAPIRDAEAAERLLAGAAAEQLDQALDLGAPAVAQLRARVTCLRDWMPELALPDLDEAALRRLLPALCLGRRSFEELRRAPLAELLRAQLSPAQQAALDRHAPERLQVPSGRRLRLQYQPGRAPVLAVRIQELFGCSDTPRLAAGRVPVLLHLLAPNGRPQQVTDDLAGFWSRTYPEVRKQLRARYPKHAWPEDPRHERR